MVSHNTGINIFVNTVGGKWKGLILYFLSQQSIRTKDFYPLIPGITQKVLTDQLKQLERDGLVQRELFPEVPPRVEYSLTDLGQSFVPILNIMCEWGNTYALARDIEKDGQIRCSHEAKKA
ncbi:putative HTH-type transcriptional regulator YkvN [Paenibacillus albidus]|uniref:HTH-type transcriptional regulator YkvN n=1 Tax=Paenibacillus albidus TaxID=2041023 RepID=A0A917CKW4_9BACL|nr:helix-turn-helix domain-containing protein [Paenibacillus albidus]GGF92009.1 putative HTH-type transcriptional regulator YkvN [Paenibacillus albidus]